MMFPYTRLSVVWLLVGMIQFGFSGIIVVNGLDLGPNQPHHEIGDSTPGAYSSDGSAPHQTMPLGRGYVNADNGSSSDLSSNPFPPHLSVLEPEKSAQDPTTIAGAQQAIGALFQSSPVDVTSDQNNNDKSVLAAEEGVSFSRTISQFPPDTSVTFEFLSNNNTNNGRDESSLQRVCSTKDAYGDNNCHYNWDDGVVIKYLIEANTPFTEDYYIMGSFMIDGRIPWSFTCKMCGDDCVLQVPVIKLDFSLPMPPCPIQPNKRSHTLEYHLWKSSPSHGWVSTSFEGTVSLSTKTTDGTSSSGGLRHGNRGVGEHHATDTSIAKLSISATVL